MPGDVAGDAAGGGRDREPSRDDRDRRDDPRSDATDELFRLASGFAADDPHRTDAMPPISAVRFEQALAELEAILRELEDGTTNLEDSLARYERGVGLLRQCYCSIARRRAEE